MSTPSLRIGLIGAGHIARTVHAPVLTALAQRNPRLTFAAVCDLNEELARHCAAAHGVAEFYRQPADMLRHAKLDALYVLVPPTVSARVATETLAAGLPLFLEKPPAMTPAELEALRVAADRAHVPIFVAFNRRHVPVVEALAERLRAFLANGGRLEELAGELLRVNRRDADFTTTALHAIDTLRFVAGTDYRTMDCEYLPTSSGHWAFRAQGTMTDGATWNLWINPDATEASESLRVRSGHRTWAASVPFHGIAPGGPAGLTCENDRAVEVWAKSAPPEIAALPGGATGFWQENEHFLAGVMARVKDFGSNGLESARQAVLMADAWRRRVAHLEFPVDSRMV